MANVTRAALIALIVWWFWLYQAKEVGLKVVQNETYKPSRINIIANQATELHFLRKNASPCAEVLIFADLDISTSPPVNKSMTIKLPALARCEYEFHCQMQLNRGWLPVAEA